MIQLLPAECRVLGVLIEKAQTTPAQYPLTLNALVSGANQRNNRDPVTSYGDEEILDALDGLRSKGLVREVMLSGSRVTKYRHVAREVLGVETPALVILAELLLRGPQTVGEIRSRGSRMHALESTEAVEAVLESLAAREEPLARRVAPAPGTRAPRYAQLLCPELHPTEGGRTPVVREAGSAGRDELADRVERLELEVAELRRTVDALAQAAGRAGLTEEKS
jgi:uncharacterized protein